MHNYKHSETCESTCYCPDNCAHIHMHQQRYVALSTTLRYLPEGRRRILTPWIGGEMVLLDSKYLLYGTMIRR